MMGKGGGLGMLKVGVAHHNGVCVFFSHLDDNLNKKK